MLDFSKSGGLEWVHNLIVARGGNGTFDNHCAIAATSCFDQSDMQRTLVVLGSNRASPENHMLTQRGREQAVEHLRIC